MTALPRTFRDRIAYTPTPQYRLLPFRFTQLEGDAYVMTNEAGEYTVEDRQTIAALVSRELRPDSVAYKTFKSKHFLFDDDSRVALDLLALKYRTRMQGLSSFTGLHIFVVTLRCDHSCHYCQVSRQTEDRAHYDMTPEHADKAVDLVFRSPAENLKIEFQGGEPLLNFELVRHVVERACDRNVHAKRNLQFVIATNLSRLSDDMLSFCKAHEICLSTSLDGPRDLHDAHRPLRGASSHAAVTDAIRRARLALGHDSVAALMTTTPASLNRVESIIDEYVAQEFHSIFLRYMSPYGFAARSLVRRYTREDWLAFYKRGLAYVLHLNQHGYPLVEEFTRILLQKILSPAGSTYVDLQSPAGIGIGALVYNYDGAVYASDEGRMLAETGDDAFRLGHVDSSTYESMMTSDTLVSALDSTMLEGAPMCNECAFLPYCGADPVFHKATQGDVVGHKAFSDFCARQMGCLRHVIGLLENDPAARETLSSWI